MQRSMHIQLEAVQYERYAGPPGHIKLADVVNQELSRSFSAGYCDTGGAPFVYKCDYEAFCVALDDQVVWDTGHGRDKLAASEGIWIPNGGRASYHAPTQGRFIYVTYPVNWPEIIGWSASDGAKQIDGTGNTGPIDRVRRVRFTDIKTLELSDLLRAKADSSVAVQGDELQAGITTIERTNGSICSAADTLLVLLDTGGTVVLDSGDCKLSHGDLIWLPTGTSFECRDSIASQRAVWIQCRHST